MNFANNSGSARRRRGIFLVVVLVVLAVATLAAYSFTETMLAYDESAHLAGDRVQTRAAAESGVEMVRRVLAQPHEARDMAGGVLANPAMFQAVTVVSPEAEGRAINFSILTHGMDEAGRLAGVRFGLQNESAKLNVNALIALDSYSDALGPAMAAMAAQAGNEAAFAEGMEAMDGELSLAQSLLLTLPGMTIDTAEAILDWLDPDDEPRPFGAESEFYSTLPTPYEPRNGPIDSVEELLLVRGVTPELLFGVDANRNGVIDPAEQQLGLVDFTSVASLGWSAFLTVHGREANRRRDGSPRVNINNDNLETLYDELSFALDNDDYATFIVAYRIAGGGNGGGGDRREGGGRGDNGGEPGGGDAPIGIEPFGAATGGGGAGSASPEEFVNFQDPRGGGGRGGAGRGRGGDRGGGGGRGRGGDNAAETEPVPWTADAFAELDLTGGGGTKLTQVLDLIDATVTIGQGETAQTFTSPFTSDPVQMAMYMPLLMDALTTQNHTAVPGRININECPVELLYGIPVLDAESVEAIVEARSMPSESENRLFETWPLVEGLITLETMRLLLPLVTTGGDVYRAQVIGYHESAAAFTRLEVVIDATGPNPRMVQYRDLSHLGRGFDTSVLGIRHFITQ